MSNFSLGDEFDLNQWSFVLSRLGEIAIGNPNAIAMLEQIIKDTEQKLIKHTHLNVKDFNLNSMDELALRRMDELALRRFDSQLKKIDLGKLLEEERRKDFSQGQIFWRAINSLIKIDPGNQIALQALGNNMALSEKAFTFLEEDMIKNLLKIDSIRTTTMQRLERLIDSAKDEDTYLRAAYYLGKIAPGNSTAISTLLQLLKSTKNNPLFKRVTDSLAEIGIGNPKAIAALEQLLKSAKYETYETRRTCSLVAECLGKIDPGNSTAILTLVQVLKSAKGINLRTIRMLREIAIGNPKAIAVLEQLLDSTEDEDRRWEVAYNLGKIDPGNSTAILTLVQLLESTKDEFIFESLTDSLAEIGIGNPTAITLAIQLIKSTKNSEILQEVTEGLRESLSEKWFAEIVSALKAPINRFWRFHAGYQVTTCYNVIWHCAQNMTYPAFYEAWHSNNSDTNATQMPHKASI
ncbi:MAG: HEAT repeat domain-containing protein [Xenococcaceae cyanobacterium]